MPCGALAHIKQVSIQNYEEKTHQMSCCSGPVFFSLLVMEDV